MFRTLLTLLSLLDTSTLVLSYRYDQNVRDLECDGAISKKCMQRGGSCVSRPFKSNCDGKLYKKLCTGKSCACCVPRCKDQISQCRYWKMFCDSKLNSVYIKDVCSETCDTCNSVITVPTDETWSEIKSACIEGNNMKTLYNIPTIDVCKEKCEKRKGCKSIDYNPKRYWCNLSELKSDSEYYTEPCYNNQKWLYAEIEVDVVPCVPREVCRDGFIGDRCEHDCETEDCPDQEAPVCAGDAEIGVDLAYYNKCFFYKAKCIIERLVFKYDGACQDDAVCGAINCPMEGPVEYYDNPNRPGCKLCRTDTNPSC